MFLVNIKKLALVAFIATKPVDIVFEQTIDKIKFVIKHYVSS